MKELLTEFLADLLGEADSPAAKQAKAAKLKSIPNSRGLWSPTGKKTSYRINKRWEIYFNCTREARRQKGSI